MNPEQFVDQWLRDFSLVMRTPYHSRITDFLTTICEPIF